MARTRTSEVVIKVLFLRLLLRALLEVETRDELEVGAGAILQPQYKEKYQYLPRVVIRQYLLMQIFYMGTCIIITRGIEHLRLHLVLLPT